MKSTFKVLFYVKKQSVKSGKAPIMGRITINGTQAGFSCKKEVSLALWDVKANRARGKSEEARTLNQELDNIKAQITRHYQYICDHDSFVTAKKVYNRYVGFSEEYHTLASSGFLNPSRSGQHVQERTFRTRFIHGKHQSPATGTGHRVLSTGKHLGNTSGRRDTNH